MGKNLDPNLKPEKQHAISKQGSMERPCVGQGRAGSRRKRPDPNNQPINQQSNVSQKVPGRTEIETRKTNHVHTKDPDAFCKQCGWQDDKKNPSIPDVSFPSRSSLQTPTQTHQTEYVISSGFMEFN